ncbi:hypothetical protein JK386_16385 [Nocardioides sp. zg-536]|uniref:Uncharacterized protein n=1 Tax=Nocardioides faecalis TaxID=2803858 RepID=A0A938YBA3_9ACTN|nr:hypothetical protein [Nocardioides faecalis]MBM9461483.1 hypothetical protein [Nocardioides faecalis]MBS4751811.1 hypothetical protein [Nocardioides faecalis]QVI59330.1 hypothetical protein KG111_02875 [Nocardioides faecalis]
MSALVPDHSRAIVDRLEAAVDVEGLLAQHAATGGAAGALADPGAVEPPD